MKDFWSMTKKIMWSDEAKFELFGMNAKCRVWRKLLITHHLPNNSHTPPCFSKLWGYFSVVGTARVFRTERWMQKCWMKTCSRFLRTLDWDKGWTSNKTTTLSVQRRQPRCGFKRSLWMSLSGPDQTWIWSNISGAIWKWLHSWSNLDGTWERM